MIVDLLIGLLVSAGCGLLLTPVARACAFRLNLLDHPDGGRKIHAKSTPVAGGLAILAAMLLTVGFLLLYSPAVRAELLKDQSFLLGMGLASVLICLLGVLDDYGLLRGRHKLLGQVIIVSLLIALGMRVDSFQLFGYTLQLGWLAIPFTVFWMLGAINSLNLLDGMDGFLASIAIIATLGFGCMAYLNHSWPAACIALVLAGALIGFLRYNFPPASIFLGDSGSMLIGLTIGVLAIKSSLKGAAMVSLAAPLAIMTLPILDTFAAIIRRKLTGRSIYATDRGHLHHCLSSKGLSNRHVLAYVALMSSLTMLGALASLFLKSELLALLSAVMVVGILITTRLFGYVEFVLLQKSLTQRTQRFFGAQGESKGQNLEVQLQGKIAWKQKWDRLRAAAEDLRMQRLTLNVNAPAFHEGYHARWANGSDVVENLSQWSLCLPLRVHGRIVGRLEGAGSRQADFFWDSLTKFAELAEEFELHLSQEFPAPLLPERSDAELVLTS